MGGPPFRRTSDRFEEIGRRGCKALALLGVPLAIALGWNSHAEAAEDAQAYRSTLHHAEATTLEPAPSVPPGPQSRQPSVEARWAGPNRVVQHGTVQVPQGSEAGYELFVWTTATGEITDAPPSRSQLIVDAVLLAAKVMLGVGAVAGGAFLLLRHGMERWRSREWDAAWESFANHRGRRDDRL
jgi:hypothetical protein